MGSAGASVAIFIVKLEQPDWQPSSRTRTILALEVDPMYRRLQVSKFWLPCPVNTLHFWLRACCEVASQQEPHVYIRSEVCLIAQTCAIQSGVPTERAAFPQ